MDNGQLIKLLERYMDSAITEAETRELFEYVANPGHEQQVTASLEAALKKEGESDTLTTQQQNIILNKIFEGEPARSSKVSAITWVKIAAAIIVVLLSGLLLINKKSVNTTTLAISQVHPGKNKAILTLSNGQKVDLDDTKNGAISQQGNAKVIKLANGQLAYNAQSDIAPTTVYNTMTTPRGGKYDLTLADGTKVWLDAASSITYPTSFNGVDRTVTITGEAYFEVAHNKDKPFRVNVQGQTVEVLGTHFNINAYADEDGIKTTLLEGKVKVTKGTEKAILIPGQQSVIAFNYAGIMVKEVNTEDAVAWKNGLTSFNKTDIKSIMRQISRWYDIDVAFKGNMPANRLFTGDISRSAELVDVLKVLQLSGINFTTDGKKLIVSP